VGKMMRKYLSAAYGALFAGVLTAGCSVPLSLQVRDPKPADIIDYVVLFQPYSRGTIQTGADYVWAGYSYVDHHCSKFFEALEEGRMQLAFAKHTTAAGFSAANTFMTLAKKSQQSIGVVGAAGTLISAVMDSATNDFFYGQFSGLAQFSGALWLQTTVAQDDFKNKNQTVKDNYDAVKSAALTSVAVQARAHNIVQSYANLCTIQQMQVFIQTALNKTPAKPAADDGKAVVKTGANGQAVRPKESYGARSRSTGGMSGYAIY
jgi:hypothetical protein